MKRFSIMAGVAVVAAGALTAAAPVLASPASAAGSCGESQWDRHPDLISTGTFKWREGTSIHTAGYNTCTIIGRGYGTQGIDVHCGRFNANGVAWVYARNTTTGVAGWSRADELITTGSAAIPNCN